MHNLHIYICRELEAAKTAKSRQVSAGCIPMKNLEGSYAGMNLKNPPTLLDFSGAGFCVSVRVMVVLQFTKKCHNVSNFVKFPSQK